MNSTKMSNQNKSKKLKTSLTNPSLLIAIQFLLVAIFFFTPVFACFTIYFTAMRQTNAKSQEKHKKTKRQPSHWYYLHSKK